MKTKNVIVTFLLFLVGGFSACENPDNVLPDDDFLLRLAYDRNYRFPVGFYYEKDLIGSRYYENTVSVSPTNQRDRVWIELHTNDKEEARTWSNLSNEYSSVNRILVSESVTEKYFEFVRVNEVRETDVLLSRVHRSDYFIPLFDKFKYSLPILFGEHIKDFTFGVYKGIVTLDKIKELTEYLWDCYSFSISDSKVVKSKIYEKKDRFEHRIQSLTIAHGDWGLHDIIYVYDNVFSLDKETRILKLAERKLIREIQGNYNAGMGR